ncbi:MAG: thiol-activated cytolysin family protein [Oscillospiraceae bacterium]|nr:thiol-activated cytolysin family protein [Oscillospiraceae bacterium]
MNQELNNHILSLQYDPEAILTISGQDTTSFIPNQGRLDNQTYVVVHKEEASLEAHNAELSALENLENSVYPGAIVLADRRLMENTPTVPAFKRAPMTFYIDLPGMGKAGRFTIENPTQSNLKTAVMEKFKEWCDQYSHDYKINAVIKYKDTMAYSESQLSTALNLNFKNVSSELGVDFKAIASGKKSVMLCEYEQIFYNVLCDKPEHPADVFDNSVTPQDLRDKGVCNSAPPAYVHAASYGRRIFVKLETTSNSSLVEAALHASMQDNFDIKAHAEYKEILDNTSMSVIVLGGGTQYASQLINADTLKTIKDILAQSADCGKENPGCLFSYACNFLKDDRSAVVNESSKYIETTCTEYPGGCITLDHNGAYVAYFNVNWKERRYDEKGKETFDNRSFSGNGKYRTAHYAEDIPLGGNCYDIHVSAHEFTGLVWDNVRQVFDVKGVCLLPRRTFHIGGTTLSPSKSIDPAL